jgi:mono/diheme cytochrome c family protein
MIRDRTRRPLVAALLGLASLPCIALAQGRPRFDLKDPTVIAQGQTLFNQRCAGRCHGVDGADGFDGPILRGRTYLDPAFVFATLMTGRPGSAMPPWNGRLSDDDLWKVIAFVASLGDQARAATTK